jgi:putative membrane protein
MSSEPQGESPTQVPATAPETGAAVAETNAPSPAFDTPQRLHPSSLLFEFMSSVRKQLFPAIIALFGATQWGRTGLVIASVFFALTMVGAIFRYVTVRFQIRGTDLIVNQGLIFRRDRTIPIHRIQNIDSLQTLPHQLFGVAEVRIETASGQEPEATLRVLSLPKIEQLRARIFARTATVPAACVSTAPTVLDPSGSAPIAEEPAVRLLAIPASLLVKAGLLSNRGMVIAAVALGAFLQFSSFGDEWYQSLWRWVEFIPWNFLAHSWVLAIGIVLAILVLLRIFSALWYVLRFHGFVLERRGEEFRITCGLFSRMSATIPRSRIQLVHVRRGVLEKALGLASIRIETAGGAAASHEKSAATISRHWFVPVIREADVPRIFREIRPGLEWDERQMEWQPLARHAARRLRRWAMALAVIATIPSAILLPPWGWGVGAVTLGVGWLYAEKKAAAMRYSRGAFGIAFRSGMLTKKCSVTFLEKIQSVWIDHTPFDRRWRMATLCVDTAGSGPAEHRIVVPLLDAEFARRERDAIAHQASRRAISFR